MNTPKKHTSRLAIAVVLVLGSLLGWTILQKDKPQVTDEHGHAEHAEASGHTDDEHHGGEAGKPHADVFLPIDRDNFI